jgi:hypothetical protein
MNLRQFCQIREFPAVLLTTFNFDPLFFERVVMTDLLAGGARNIIVMADAKQAHEATEKARGQLFALGRKYRLIPVFAGNAFHPKLCIRMSPKAAVVACGSHNLSRSGWLGRGPNDSGNGNREATIAWHLDPDSPSAADLKNILTVLSELADSPQDRSAISGFLDASWLAKAQEENSQNLRWVITGKKTTLASLLEQRWRGRRFERLRMVTGSTDDKAAMIRWAADTFNIRQVSLEVDADSCGLAPSILGNLPVELRLFLTESNPRTHLKIALFESAEGTAAVVGSANCSGAAWLRSCNEGGNIESVIVYDQCDPPEFNKLFQATYDDTKPWYTVGLTPKLSKPNDEEKNKAPKLQLRQIRFEKSTERILVSLMPDPPADEQVFAVIGQQRFPLHYSLAEGMWIAQAVNIPPDICTPFGCVEVGTLGHATNSVWIDDVDALAGTSDWRMPLRAIRKMSQHMVSAEYRKLLNDLRLLSNTLLNNKDDFPDTILSQHQNVTIEPETQSQPLEPNALIKSISDLHVSSPHHQGGVVQSMTLSLTGIMRLFFYEASNEDAQYDPTGVESEKSQEEDERQTASEPDDRTDIPKEYKPSNKEKERLIKELNEFVDKLSSPEFATRCSARQLQQAVAYPLAVASFASQGPWAEDIEEKLSEIVVRTVEVLLKRKIKLIGNNQQTELKPLLEETLIRYRKENREENFQRVIGDGVLWLVLTSALSMIQQQSRQFELSLFVADVAQNKLLTATAVPEQIVPLAKRLGEKGSPLASIEYTKRVVEAVKLLEEHFIAYWQQFEQDGQVKRIFNDEVGDWLWRPKMGFVKIVSLHKDRTQARIHARTRAADMDVYLNYYLNLRQLQAKDDRIRGLMDELGGENCEHV